MKAYLCFLKNNAANRPIDSVFLGVASSEQIAIELCIKSVGMIALKATNNAKKYAKESNYLTTAEKEKRAKRHAEGDAKSDLVINELLEKDIQNVAQLNEALQPYYRKIGVAKRWCVVEEQEMDCLPQAISNDYT